MNRSCHLLCLRVIWTHGSELVSIPWHTDVFFHLLSIAFPDVSLAVSCWLAGVFANNGFGPWSIWYLSLNLCNIMMKEREELFPSIDLVHSACLMPNTMSIMKLVFDDFTWDGTSLRLQKKANQFLLFFFFYNTLKNLRAFYLLSFYHFIFGTLLPNLFFVPDYVWLKKNLKTHQKTQIRNCESALNLEIKCFECISRV